MKNTILITGGTGSFGNSMCRRLLQTDLKEIRIFSRDEKKQDDMRRRYGDKRLVFYIGDVRNYQSILEAMTGVDFVFNAAALKQVPSVMRNSINPLSILRLIGIRHLACSFCCRQLQII